ncbi:hypothetical protein PQX77_020833 [Marasmius sp. AFHP31]|nr:hypothetical protein PQX77_020833 [Marasmius sp. AFHP31]
MPAYNQLCKGDEALTRTEAQETGLDRAIMIAAARDNIRISEESRSMVTTGGRSFTSTPAFGAPLPFGSSAPAVASTWSANIFEDTRMEKVIKSELNSNAKSSSDSKPANAALVTPSPISPPGHSAFGPSTAIDQALFLDFGQAPLGG